MKWGVHLILSTSQLDYILSCPLRSSVEYNHSAFN